LTPDLDEFGHGDLLATSQDLAARLDVGFDGASDVSAVVGSAGNKGELRFGVHREGKDERAVFLL
jgi:hypothetical protein